MSKSLNLVILMGHVGKIDCKRFDTGTIVNLSLATNYSTKNKQTGQYENATDWHNVTVYGKQADNVAEYVSKGSKINVRGYLKNEKYLKDNIERYITKVIAEDVIFLDSKKESNGNQQKDNYQYNQLEDDGVPF